MLAFKALHGLAPHYLTELLHLYTPSRRLCSSQSNLLVVPQTRLRSMGDKAFSFYGLVIWNSLPLELRGVQNYDGFKVQLKTYFFKLAFDYWFCFAFYCIWLHCVQRFEKLLLKALYKIKFIIIIIITKPYCLSNVICSSVWIFPLCILQLEKWKQKKKWKRDREWEGE